MCLVTRKNWNYVTGSLKKLPYQLIPFFLSMFVIVVALNHQGISTKIAEFLAENADYCVEIVKKEREISLKVGENEYSINLVKHRAPKK